MRSVRLAREAVVAGLAQPVSTAMITVVACVSVLVPMVTAGQTDAIERSVTASLEHPANRTLSISRRSGEPFAPKTLDRLRRILDIDTVYGFGVVTDYANASYPDSSDTTAKIAIIPVFGDVEFLVDIGEGRLPRAREAVVPVDRLRAIGLSDPVGALVARGTGFRLRTDPRGAIAVVGTMTLKNGTPLSEGVGLVGADATDQLVRIVVVTDTFRSAARLEPDLPTLIGVTPGDLEVASSTEFRQSIEVLAGQISGYSRTLTLVSVAIGAVFVALIVYSTLQSRRRDLGRRRALGASKGTVVALVAVQSAFASLPGCIGGALGGTYVVYRLTGFAPSAEFAINVALLGVISAIAASIPPAVVAANRDPVAALRVP